LWTILAQIARGDRTVKQTIEVMTEIANMLPRKLTVRAIIESLVFISRKNRLSYLGARHRKGPHPRHWGAKGNEMTISEMHGSRP
jgi:hypothetical protein